MPYVYNPLAFMKMSPKVDPGDPAVAITVPIGYDAIRANLMYNTGFDIPELTCAYINPAVDVTSPLGTLFPLVAAKPGVHFVPLQVIVMTKAFEQGGGNASYAISFDDGNGTSLFWINSPGSDSVPGQYLIFNRSDFYLNFAAPSLDQNILVKIQTPSTCPLNQKSVCVIGMNL